MINTLYGFQLVENNILIKTRQKKNHKWKWLNWIYRKVYGYESIPDPKVYIMGNKIIGHPMTLKALIDGTNKLRSI